MEGSGPTMKASDFLFHEAERLRLLEEFSEDASTLYQEAVSALGEDIREAVDREMKRWSNALQLASATGES